MSTEDAQPSAAPVSPTTLRTTRPAPAVDRISPTPAPIQGEVPADLLANIIADAAQRSGVDAAAIVVQQGEAVEWNDGSMGCPQPGVAYLQVIIPGYRVVLQAGDNNYDYRADTRGRFLLCQK